MRNTLTKHISASVKALLVSALLCACQQKADKLVNLDYSSMAAVPETVTIVIKNYKPQSGNSY